MMKKHLKKVMMLIILLAMCISFGMQNIHADDNTFEATNEACKRELIWLCIKAQVECQIIQIIDIE